MIDQVFINVNSGNGGNGAISGRHEKFIPKGGPDGGDGGNGGSIVFVGNRNLNTLLTFRYQKIFVAENGGNGSSKNKHGNNGKDMLIEVPIGTQITNVDNELIVDMTNHNQIFIVAQGGRGGYGNVKYTSSTNQYPVIAQNGEQGINLELKLELKLLADIGIVGFPNAGKSSLIKYLTAAKPKIADYPFTTIEPNLGIVDIHDKQFVIVDIPGLIEGANTGIGLGHHFLRHIERSKILIHLVDASVDNIQEQILNINNELKLFNPSLLEKPQVIVLNKLDLDEVKILTSDILDTIKDISTKPYFISAISGEGIKEMMSAVIQTLEDHNSSIAKHKDINSNHITTLIQPSPIKRNVSIIIENDVYIVEAPGVERIATRINYEDWMARMQLYKHMKKTGVVQALEEAGIAAGDTVRLGNVEWEWD